MLYRDDGPHMVGPGGVQAKAPIPRQTIALNGAGGELVHHIVGFAGGGDAAGEQISIQLFARMFHGKGMALQAIGFPHQLAQHGLVFGIQGIGLCAVAVGCAIGAHGLHCMPLAARGGEHPLHLLARLGGHGAGQAGAVVFLAPASGNAPTHGFAAAVSGF